MTGGMVLWRAGCGGSRTSGSEGGPGKRAGRKARTAPWSRPYFGGFLCSRVGRADVGLRDYQALESSLLHELDLAFFEDRYLVAGTAGQRVLDAMARAGGRLSALSLRRTLADLPNVDVVVRRLVDRGLVYRPTRGTYDFALPLFGSYLRRRAELTELTGRR